MTKCILVSSVVAFACAASLCEMACASPVVYSLTTVSDGRLGEIAFFEAPIEIEFHGDTSNVVQEVSPTGHVFVNYQGYATIRVTINNKAYFARFANREIYVRYDVTNGLVGFGSRVSPTYPITVGCGDADCAHGDNSVTNGIAQALAIFAVNPTLTGQSSASLSAATLKLPTSLTQTTLLTGSTHACPVAYTLTDLGAPHACSPPNPLPMLHTDHGDFYLQDKVINPDNTFGNMAFFTVVANAYDD